MSETKRDLVIPYVILATLCGLWKPTFVLYFIMQAGYVFCTFYREGEKRLALKVLVSTLIGLTVISLYILFVRVYNDINLVHYYTTAPKPIWSADSTQVSDSWLAITKYWYNKYYYPSTIHFLLVALALVFVLVRGKDLLLTVSLFIACIAYALLFFTQFKDHDYYFIVFIPLLVISTMFVMEKIIRISTPVKLLTGGFVAILAVLSLKYGSLNITRRYTVDNVEDSSLPRYQLYGIESTIEQLSIARNARFVVVGDPTQNGSLVFLNRFGWTFDSFNSQQQNLLKALQTADYLLVLQPSKNPIPEGVKKYIGVKLLKDYKSNHLYAVVGNS